MKDYEAAWSRFVDATLALIEMHQPIPMARAGVCQDYYRDISMITIPVSGALIRQAENGSPALQKLAALVHSLPTCPHTVVFSIDELQQCAAVLGPYARAVGLEGATLSTVVESLMERVQRLTRERDLLTPGGGRSDDCTNGETTK